MDQYQLLIGIVTVFLGFPIYFVPAVIAARRDHPKKKQILWWNLFAAWTAVVWVVLIFIAARGSAFDKQEEKSES
ncbi:MAG: superinfection immunity protein [Clostridia bacterium]|nr:superinfection immunity protein [Clostridia bacterium]